MVSFINTAPQEESIIITYPALTVTGMLEISTVLEQRQGTPWICCQFLAELGHNWNYDPVVVPDIQYSAKVLGRREIL